MKTQYLNPMLILCWASVVDGGPTSNEHYERKHDTPIQCWLNVGQHHRRLTNLEPAFGQCIMLTGIAHTVRTIIPALGSCGSTV